MRAWGAFVGGKVRRWSAKSSAVVLVTRANTVSAIVKKDNSAFALEQTCMFEANRPRSLSLMWFGWMSTYRYKLFACTARYVLSRLCVRAQSGAHVSAGPDDNKSASDMLVITGSGDTRLDSSPDDLGTMETSVGNSSGNRSYRAQVASLRVCVECERGRSPRTIRSILLRYLPSAAACLLTNSFYSRR